MISAVARDVNGVNATAIVDGVRSRLKERRHLSKDGTDIGADGGVKPVNRVTSKDVAEVKLVRISDGQKVEDHRGHRLVVAGNNVGV